MHRDYTGSGFDRGHMCPHSDRAANEEMSFATFVMSNIIPQAPQCESEGVGADGNVLPGTGAQSAPAALCDRGAAGERGAGVGGFQGDDWAGERGDGAGGVLEGGGGGA